MTNATSFIDDWTEHCKKIETIEIPANFADLIDSASKNYPEKIAINAFEDEATLTFKDLSDRVFMFANGLSDLGVKRGSHVAVIMSNRIEYPITWLALASLGAVMVPTITRLTSFEMDFLLNDADVEFVIVENDYISLVESMNNRPAVMTDRHVIALDGDPKYSSFAEVEKSGSPDFRTAETVTSDDLVNIQYTSGTTGLPKGCMQPQRFWLITACSLAEMEPGIKSLLADHPFFYIDPQWMLLCALKTGGTLYLAKNLSSSRYLDWVCEHPIDFSYFPKPLLNLPPDPREKQHGVKKFTTGSISRAILKEGESRLGVPIRQNYGMTEIGAGLMVPDNTPDEDILDTCGVPAPFRELRIIDENGNDVPDGERGELIVRGDGIFKGYYNRPEANEENFIDDWFRTGDLFVRTEKGYYKIVGRIKDMIRRSGENIAALEVELAAMEFEPIAEAAAVPVPDEYRGEEVKLYVRLKDGVDEKDVPEEKILDFCKERLASFKLPRFIQYIKEFSYTPSEKIEKTKLINDAHGDLRKGAWDALEKK